MPTSLKKSTAHARILINIDLVGHLFQKLVIQLSNGTVLDQDVVYENLPLYCPLCKKFGHSDSKHTTVTHSQTTQETDSLNLLHINGITNCVISPTPTVKPLLQKRQNAVQVKNKKPESQKKAKDSMG